VATYTLSGSGVQTLNANVGALHVHFGTIPTSASIGHANPSNYYGLALIRAGDGTGYFPTIALDSADQWLGLPVGTTQIGYAIMGGVSITVTVVFGSSPLVSPTPSLGSLTDVLVSGASNGDLLTWVSSASKWENKPPSAPSLTFVKSTLAADVTLTTSGTLVNILTVALTPGTWLIWGPILFQNATSLQIAMWHITDGTTIFGSGDNVMATGSQDYQNMVWAVVTPASNTTYTLQATINASSSTKVLASTRSGNVWARQPISTELMALKLA